MTLPENPSRALRAVADPSPFDAIRKLDEQGEYWLARDLMNLVGYSRWQRFEDAILRAIAAIDNVADRTGEPARQHAYRLREAADGGAPGTVRIDYRLTRHGAYMTVMNGDPRKPEIAAAQTYFAVSTRQAEIVKADAPVSPAPYYSGEDDLDAIENLLQIMRRDRRRVAALEAEQAQQQNQQRELAARMDGIEGRHDWFAALAYAKMNGLSTERGYLQRLGTAAGRISRRMGFEPAKTQHALFGTVNTYPIAALDAAVEALGGAA